MALAIVCVVGRARAQRMDEESVIVPPRLKQNVPAGYPEQAVRDRFVGSATVELSLDIDAAGAVKSATVVEAQGHGFDEAAVAAANRLSFDPATRDGHPKPARIRFRFSFFSPPPKVVGRVATVATDRPIAGATVVVTDANGHAHTTTSDAEGHWSITDELPVGRAHVRVSGLRRVARETDEELAPGEETNIVLRLESEPEPTEIRDGGAPDAEAIEEVVVRGQRPPREVTKRTLEREEIQYIPGTNGDALRSLQNLPGVARPPPFSGALAVRGSAPQDTNIYINQTNIPIVYHFGGLSSVVPSELIDKIDFFPGNYSAQYGRGMGGIVDVTLRDPKADALHALAQLDLIDARVMAEGPIFKTGWNFLIAGRRSWFDLWLAPILSSTGAQATIAPRYYDYQAMLQRDIGKNSSFRLTLFGSDDALSIVSATANAQNPTFSGNISFHTAFWRLQAQYDNRINKNTELRAVVAVGEDSVNSAFGSNQITTTTYPLSGRVELSQKIGKLITANLGIDLLYEPYSFDYQLPPPNVAGQPPGGPGQLPVQSSQSGSLFLPGAYAEIEVKPARDLRLLGGVRADFDSATSAWDVAPRIMARYDLRSGLRRTTLKAGFGVFDQPPTPMETDPKLGQTGLVSNRAIHYDVGIEQEFTRQIDMSVDAFYKSFENLVEAGSGNSGSGFAYGAELLLRYKPDKHFFGWVSYTISRSERQTSSGAPLYLFNFDQTHILTVLGSYHWGKGWRLGARFRLVSGPLYTPTTAGAFDASVGSQLGVSAYPPDGQRLPLFWEVDVRADKTWIVHVLKREMRISAYIDIENLFNANDPQAVQYNFNYTQSANINGLPILPIIGLRGEL
jgi:TonB family protein